MLLLFVFLMKKYYVLCEVGFEVKNKDKDLTTTEAGLFS
jgi:hypothetical protein